MIKNMAEYLPKPRKKEDIEKELKAERKKREALKAKESIAALGTLAQDFYVADSRHLAEGGDYSGGNRLAMEESFRRSRELNEELKKLREAKYQALSRQGDFLAFSAPSAVGIDSIHDYINKQGAYAEQEKLLVPKPFYSEELPYHEIQTKQYNYIPYDEMTEDERKRYNYLYAKEGTQAAKQYLKDIAESLNERTSDKYAASAEGYPLAKIAYSPIVGMDSFVSGVKQNFNPEEALSPSAMGLTGEKIRSTLSGASGLAYDVGHMIGNQAIPIFASSVLSPAAGSGLFGLSSKGNAQNWALKNGFSPEQAQAYGMISGASEMLLQKTLGGITKLGGGMLKESFSEGLKAINNGLLRVVSQYGASMLSEGFEEGLQEALEPVFKSLALGAEYKPAELSDIVYASLLGMIGGAVFETPEIAGNEMAMRAQGKAIKKQGVGAIGEVIEQGLSTNPEGYTYRGAEVLQKRIEKGREVDNYTLGRVQAGNELAEQMGDTPENRIREIGKALGKDVEFFDEADSNRNGYFKDGKIYINRQSKNPMAQIFSHELTHSAELAENYQRLSDIVVGKLRSEGALVEKKIKKHYDYWRAGVDLSDSEVTAELVAEYVEKNLFTNEMAIRELVKENKAIGKRVFRWTLRALNQVRANMGDRAAQEQLFLQKARELYRHVLTETTGEGVDGTKNLIKTDARGVKYVEIDKDILKGLPQEDWGRAVKDYLQKAFPKGIIVNGQLISVNSSTRKEITRSKDTARLYQKDSQKYYDKMRAIGNIDEILSIPKDYTNNELHKQRKDNLTSFTDATAYFKVGSNGYKAEIKIGLQNDGKAILYDIVRMVPKTFYSVSPKENEIKKPWTITAPAINSFAAYHGLLNQSIPRAGEAVKHSLSNYDERARAEDFDFWSDEAWDMLEESRKEREVQGAELGDISEQAMKKIGREEQRLKRVLKRLLGGYKFANENHIDKAIRALSAEYVRTGMISEKVKNQVFDKFYRGLLVKDDRFYKEYKHVRDRLKATRIAISPKDRAGIPDFNKFRQKSLWALTIRNDGIPVDVVYQELSQAHPELFPEEITHPADQLMQLYDVASSIRVTEKRLSSYWGEDDGTLFEMAKKDFAVEVGNFAAKLSRVQRLEADIRAWEELKKGISDFTRLDENLEAVKERRRKLLIAIEDIKKYRLKKRADRDILNKYMEGKLSREEVEQRTEKARSIFLLYGKERELTEVNKYLARLEKMKKRRQYEAEREQARKEREWLKEPIKTKEDIQKLYEEKAKIRKAYDKASRGRKFLAEDWKYLNGLNRGDFSVEYVLQHSDRAQDIFHAHSLFKRLELFEKKVERYRNSARKQFDEAAAADLEAANWSEWKDKPLGIGYQRETAMRNVEDIVPDKGAARKIYQKYFGKISEAEAKANRFKNDYAERIRALELSRSKAKGNVASESAAVQFLGEARYYMEVLKDAEAGEKAGGYTLGEWEDLTEKFLKDSPNLDLGKINAAIEVFRSVYDEIFPKINEVRIRFGYDPIEYRKGYFPHFSEDVAPASFIEEMQRDISTRMGFYSAEENLPTEIAGKTHDRKPGIKYFAHAEQRKGFDTVYDAVQGFDRYVDGAAMIIFHTENIQRLRALERQIRYKTTDEAGKAEMDEIMAMTHLTEEEQMARIEGVKAGRKYKLSNFAVWLTEYTNLLAGKKSKHDRAAEERGSRGIYVATNKIISRIAGNQIAGNIGSAVTNIIPILQSFGELSTGEIIRGASDYVQSLKRDSADDFAKRSVFLTNRRGYKPMTQSFSGKWSGILSSLMEVADMFSAETITRGRYFQNIKRGMSSDRAITDADEFAARIMADRSRGMTPTLFAEKSPLVRLFTMYQLEVNNQLSYLFKDMPRAYAEKEIKDLVAAYMRFFLASWLFNEVYEALFGRRAALDPIGIMNEAAGDFTGYKLPNFVDAALDLAGGKEADFTANKLRNSEALTNLGNNLLRELPVVGSVLGGGRVPISSAFPDIFKLQKIADPEIDSKKKAEILRKELSKPLFSVAMPFAGGQLKKMLEGGTAAINGGDYTLSNTGEKKLNFAVHNDGTLLGKAIRGVQGLVGGRMAYREAREWKEAGFRGLGTKQTEIYEQMLASGERSETAWKAIKELSSIKSTEAESLLFEKLKALEAMDLKQGARAALYYGELASESEKGYLDGMKARKIDVEKVLPVLLALKKEENALKDKEILLKASLSLEEKERLYREVIARENEEKSIDEYRKQGLTIDDYLSAKVAYKKIDESGKNSKERSLELVRWVNKQSYSDQQKAFLREKFKMQQTTYYDRLIGSGVSEENSYRIAEALNQLEAEDGQSMISRRQQWQAVLELDIPKEEKERAIFQLMSSSQQKKLEAGKAHGISAEMYILFLKAAEEGGTGSSINQKEAATILQKMQISIQAKAALWQMQGKNWKPMKNPFNKAIGQKVYAAMNKKK